MRFQETKRVIRPSLLILAFLVLCSFSKIVEDGVFEQYYKRNLITKGIVENGARQGLWSFYHPNNQLHFQGTFLDDAKHGVWKYFDDKEQLVTSVNFNGNAVHGEKTYFNNEGVKLAIEHFENGLFTGNTDYYSNQGSVSARLEAKNQHRVFKSYHPNGNLKFITVDWKSKKNDTTRVYFENGQLKEELSFYKNILLAIGSTYQPNGELLDNGNFEDGSGKVIRYHDNLEPSSIAMYKAGLKNGITQFYYPNGQLQSAGMFARGAKTGVWKFYSEEGELENTIEYRGEVKDDEFEQSFSPDGLSVQKFACTPEFPGGNRSFNRFLKEHLESLDTFKGKQVIVTIDLDEFGFSTGLRVHSDELNRASCEKIEGAIQNIPRCLPAFEEGLPVESTLTQPFKI